MECQKVCAAGPNDGQTMSGKKNPFCLLPLCGHFPRLSPAAFAKHYHEFVWGTKSLFCLSSTFFFLVLQNIYIRHPSNQSQILLPFLLHIQVATLVSAANQGSKREPLRVSPSKRLCDTDKDSLAKRWPPLLPPLLLAPPVPLLQRRLFACSPFPSSSDPASALLSVPIPGALPQRKRGRVSAASSS